KLFVKPLYLCAVTRHRTAATCYVTNGWAGNASNKNVVCMFLCSPFSWFPATLLFYPIHIQSVTGSHATRPKWQKHPVATTTRPIDDQCWAKGSLPTRQLVN